jgi:sphingomyelin phosphodiesterase
VKDNNFINNLYKQEKKNFRTKGREPLKIVLMSDLHLDYDYTPGMSTNCGKPLCCRSDSGLPKNANEAAGNWGNRNCDTSLKLLNNMFKTIREDIKPDMIFWGGDSIPHNLETLTLETNI